MKHSKNLKKFQTAGETPSQEEIIMSRMQAVKDLYEQGVTDMDQLVEFLNFDDQGNQVGDFSLEEVQSYLEQIMPSSESEEPVEEEEDFYSSQNPEEEETEEVEEEEEEDDEEEMRYGGLTRYQSDKSQVDTIREWAKQQQESFKNRTGQGMPTNVFPFYEDFEGPEQSVLDSIVPYPNNPNIGMAFKGGNKSMIVGLNKKGNKLAKQVNQNKIVATPTKNSIREIYADYSRKMAGGDVPMYNDGGTYIGFGWKPLQAKLGRSTAANSAKANRDTESYTNYLKENFTNGIKNMTTSALEIQNAKKMGIPVKDPLENAVRKYGGPIKKFQANNSQNTNTNQSPNPFDQKQFNTYMDEWMKTRRQGNDDWRDGDIVMSDGSVYRNGNKISDGRGSIWENNPSRNRYPGGMLFDPNDPKPFSDEYYRRGPSAYYRGPYGRGSLDFDAPLLTTPGTYTFKGGRGIPAYYEGRGGYGGYGMGDPMSYLGNFDPQYMSHFKSKTLNLPFFRRSVTTFDYGAGQDGRGGGQGMNQGMNQGMSTNQQQGQQGQQGQGYNMFRDMFQNMRERRDERRARRNAGDQSGDQGMDDQQKLPFFKRLAYGRNTPGFVTDPNNPNYEISDAYDPSGMIGDNNHLALRSERLPFWKKFTREGRKEIRNRRAQRDLDVDPEVSMDEYKFGGNYLKRYQSINSMPSPEEKERERLMKEVQFTPPPFTHRPEDDDVIIDDPNATPSPGPDRRTIEEKPDEYLPGKKFRFTDTQFDGTGLYYGMHGFGNKLITAANDAENYQNQLRDAQGFNAYNVYGQGLPEDISTGRGYSTVNAGIPMPDRNIPQQFKGRPMSEYDRFGSRIVGAQAGFEFFDESELGPDQLGGEYAYMSDDDIQEFLRNGGELEYLD